MSIGDIVLGLAAMAALATILLGGLSFHRGDGRMDRSSRYAALLTFFLLTVLLYWLAFLFITSDLSSRYVWSHSSLGLDPFYKLVGVWAGGEGGLLLWTWFMALAMVTEVVREKRRGTGMRFAAAFRTAAGSMVLLFTLILLATDLFAPTSASDLALHPDGLGMSMSLQTLEMALHPPLVFAAYASCLAVFSASLARLLSRDERWVLVALPWARLSGTLLVMGIVVGAIWAYYELGWGGYWVWDPVETASLLPMVAALAFLHAHRSQAARDGPHLPFLGVLMFVLVLVASFITRTGGLWGSSVHTYGSAVSGSIASRFLTVLEADKGIMGLFVVIVLLMVLDVVLSYRMMRTSRQREVESGVLATIALLMMYAALLLLLLIKNVGLDQGENFVEFTEKTTYLVAVILLAMFVSLSRRDLGSRRALWAGVLIGSVSVLLAAWASLTGAIPYLIPLVLLPTISVMVISVRRVATLDRSHRWAWLKKTGSHLAHVGLALIILSFIVSSSLQASLPEDREVIGLGDEVTVGGHNIRLVDLRTDPWSSSTGDPGEVRTATFDVTSGNVKRTVTVSNHYQNETAGPVLVHGGTMVLAGLVEDVYLSYDWMADGSALVQVRVIPLVSGVWAGSAVLVAGMLMMLFSTPNREEATDIV